MARRPKPERQPGDIVQVNLRIRVEERDWLAAEARAHHTTLNGEMAGRIMRTKEQFSLLTADQLVENASRLLTPYLVDAHTRAIHADLVAAAERLLGEIEPLIATGALGGAGARIRAAGDSLRAARRIVALEAGERLVGGRTTGADTGDAAPPRRLDTGDAAIPASRRAKAAAE
jgi:hypothetical protein